MSLIVGSRSLWWWIELIHLISHLKPIVVHLHGTALHHLLLLIGKLQGSLGHADASSCIHHLHLLLHLHVHALDLDQSTHFSRTASDVLTLAVDAQALNSCERSLSHLALHLHGLRCLPILHVILQVIEHSVEIDSVELHGHLGLWVLRIVNHWWRLLSIVDVRGLNSIPLLHRDFFAVQDDQILELLNDVQPVLWLSGHGIVHQRNFHEVNELGQSVDFPELRKSIAAAMKSLQSLEPLDVGQASQAIVLQLQARDDESVVERVGVDLPDPILAEVELPQLLQFLQIVNLCDLVI